MRAFSAVLAIIALCVLTAACGGSTATSPSVNVPFSTTDLVQGTGAEAVAGKTVTVNYTGWLYDATKTDQKGLQFDTSIGRSPLAFVLGTAQTIPGFDRGLVGMKVGGTRRLVIPPSLAYGEGRVGQIPPNSTLIFEVTLLTVQ